MGIERVEMIFPLFYLKAQANTGALPILCAFYCINLHNYTTTTLLLRCRTVQNLAKMKWAFNV